jgi:ABC-2 type transport system ATP-binding protein
VSIALETTGFGKRYGRQWALGDCTLSLPVGRVTALVGPNGAGKTTLMHLIAGLAQPDAGRVRVFDQAPVNNTDVLARVGFVAQDTPLYLDFTVTDLLTTGARLNRRWDTDLARARLARVDIPLDKPTGKLSGGQRAQVALAVAMAKRPDLLLLDEPVARLDPLARREFLQALMGAVAEDGTTVLLSSHIVGDLERACDYLIVLHTARVQVLGAVDELLASHKILVGQRRETADVAGTAGVAAVVTESRRQADDAPGPHRRADTRSSVDGRGRLAGGPRPGLSGQLRRRHPSWPGGPARRGGVDMIWMTWRQHGPRPCTSWSRWPSSPPCSCRSA